jgi:cobyrinic acid a,c-diamide synthase
MPVSLLICVLRHHLAVVQSSSCDYTRCCQDTQVPIHRRHVRGDEFHPSSLHCASSQPDMLLQATALQCAAL